MLEQRPAGVNCLRQHTHAQGGTDHGPCHRLGRISDFIEKEMQWKSETMRQSGSKFVGQAAAIATTSHPAACAARMPA
jgi:hypothetical protein